MASLSTGTGCNEGEIFKAAHDTASVFYKDLFEVHTPRPLEGICTYAVAHHGMSTCGVFLATSPTSWKFTGIPSAGGQRISVVLDFRYTAQPATLTLDPPSHHAEMVARLFANVGASHRIAAAPADAPAPAGDAEIKSGARSSSRATATTRCATQCS